MIYEFEKFYDDIIAEFKSAGVVVMFKVFKFFLSTQLYNKLKQASLSFLICS